ncbi:hypothetical protein LVD15_00140 [Fulvivirga maritima]|uniref:hypothetical protein n=1 Tax=Fulvivirga maritima TaxID=2904247 RepID=UPI001F250A6B|nr:hypothetical protein [Fulvivirga maritima]UII26881.1 hypothetical protein LVD15_00140 [Fulvivirga maritima]
MKNTLLILVLTFIIASCEPFYDSSIKNNSSIILEFNRNTLEEAWDGRPYMPFLQTYALSEGSKIIYFDSTNLVSKYEVLPNSYFILEHGQGIKPNYDLFNKMTIISDDTLSLNGIKGIESSFKQVDKYQWQLTFK